MIYDISIFLYRLTSVSLTMKHTGTASLSFAVNFPHSIMLSPFLYFCLAADTAYGDTGGKQERFSIIIQDPAELLSFIYPILFFLFLSQGCSAIRARWVFLFEYGSAAGTFIFIWIKEMRMLDPVRSSNPSHGFIPPRLLKSSA